ncbi:DUF732 domain-containing protein [Mycobacterium sp. GA-1285]|uniref:DUF732 domain-containing protein n=1 Tax=Mycobacterium sp. GA-1285 TaxID=1772282 RepID=UPI0012E3F79D|nr:DUF732 domain-containing protein [Mycobacterium sp. GA-1285]
MARHPWRILLTIPMAAVALAAGGVAAAAPPAVPPGPDDPGFCGAHTSSWNCWSDVSPARPGEVAFINETLSYNIAGIPSDRDRLLQIGRGICQSLAGGTSPNYIVKFLAEDLGISESKAGQGLFINAQDMACS